LLVGPLFYNPAGPGTEDGPAPHYEQLTGIISQNAPWVLTQRERRNTTKVTLTRFTEGFAGKSHELKFGVEYEGALGKSKQTYPAGMYFLDLNGAPDQVKLWAGDALQANIRRTALYAQDVWSINDKLTVTPGVRFAMYRGSVPDSGTVYSANPVAPRLGLAWDVFPNHKTVARFHYGRYHEPLVTGMFNYMNIQGRTPRITAKVLAPGVFQETTRVTPKDNYGIDPNVTQPFVEEIVAGIEREVLPDTGIQVQYVHRGYKNILAFSDTGSVYEQVQRQDPGPDGVLATADDGQMITVYNLTNPGKAFLFLTNPSGAYRNYNAVMFSLKKRFSHNWTLMADYTWSKTFGPVSNNESDNTAAGPDTGQSGIFVNPNKMINAVGNAEIDFTHQIKVNGMYHVPFLGGFNVGLRYQYLTGGAWGRTATIRGLTQGNETVRIEPRGTHRDPSYSVADLRVEKTLPLGSHRTAGVYVDAFNVTNKGVVNFIAGYGAGTIFQSGSTYGTPAMWIAPRTIRLGVRFTF
ncbi:MAG: TonB-dependent receptor, partial [Acidobacteria bacterium]|nr:TonB-dependent receptor [Acidobacteriota bacterium]